MKIGMIVLAGGVGKRIGRPFPKQFLLLGGKPLLVHVLEKARVIADIDRVVITCPETHLEETRKLIANHGFDEARFTCIVGGTSRQESVYLGLGELADVDSVIIHEAVRPLVTVDEFRAKQDFFSGVHRGSVNRSGKFAANRALGIGQSRLQTAGGIRANRGGQFLLGYGGCAAFHDH